MIYSLNRVHLAIRLNEYILETNMLYGKVDLNDISYDELSMVYTRGSIYN